MYTNDSHHSNSTEFHWLILYVSDCVHICLSVNPCLCFMCFDLPLRLHLKKKKILFLIHALLSLHRRKSAALRPSIRQLIRSSVSA